MFVWVFHRVSGLLLILLIGLKIYSGFGVVGRFGTDVVPYWTMLHDLVAVDLVLVLLFIYHSLYGLRTCLVDWGVKKEKELFWGLSAFGIVVYIFVCFNWILQ